MYGKLLLLSKVSNALLLSTLILCGQSQAITKNCSVNITPQQPIEWPKIIHTQTLSPELWVTIKTIKEWVDQEKIVFLDVRRQANTPLLGALSLPLAHIQNSVYLKQRKIVLIGDGFDQIELEHVYINLKAVGFNQVYALIDGINADLTQLKQLSYATKRYTEISPEQFLLASRTQQWQLISWNLPQQDSQKLPITPTEHWISTASTSSFIKQLVSARQVTKPLSKILIITQNQHTNQQLQKLLLDNDMTLEVLWIKGGMDGYKHYVEQHNNILINMGIPLENQCNKGFKD